MSEFRRTTIRGKKKNHDSELVGDLIDSGALIFTKTTIELSAFRKGGGFWRFLIRVVQWFRWAKTRGNPSTITHVDGWDGRVAFGSDLCDPEGGGLNRHNLPIVPHCFTTVNTSEKRSTQSDEGIEIVTKKRNSSVLKPNELALGEYEVIQLPEYLRHDFLVYQERFKNDDIKYSLTKAAKSAFSKSNFSAGVQKVAIADGIYCLLGEAFRDTHGAVIEVCCSTFLAKVLMAIEHKQKLEKVVHSSSFELYDKWQRCFKNLKIGFERTNDLYNEYRHLLKSFDKQWKEIHRSDSRHKRSELMQLCIDFEEKRGFYFQKIRKLSGNLAKRIYSMANEFHSSGFYTKYLDRKDDPILFRLNPECVTPAKLYYFLYDMIEIRK